MASGTGSASAAGEWANEVRLVGRVSGEVEARVLPSGDEVVILRLVVPRPARRRGPAVDTLDLACWTTRTRARAARLGDGDVVEVAGSLRRRFYRTGRGAASRYEVEVASLRRRPTA